MHWPETLCVYDRKHQLPTRSEFFSLRILTHFSFYQTNFSILHVVSESLWAELQVEPEYSKWARQVADLSKVLCGGKQYQQPYL